MSKWKEKNKKFKVTKVKSELKLRKKEVITLGPSEWLSRADILGTLDTCISDLRH